MWTTKLFTRWQSWSPRARGYSQLCAGLLLLLATGVLLAGTGCAGVGVVTRALSKDTNSVAIKVTTAFGGIEYRRNTDR